MTPSATQSEKIAGVNENADQAAAVSNQGTVASNNSQLNGAIQNTGYYGNEVKAGTGAVTRADDASARNAKQAMEAAGVSGTSGVAAGSATALGAKEASDLGQVRTNAYADTEKEQLAANQEDLTSSGQQTQGALGYAGINNQDAQWRAQQGAQNSSALASAILTAGFS